MQKQSVLILDVHFVTLPSLPVLSLSCFSSNFGHWISNWKLGLKPVLSSTSSGRISPFWPLAYPVAKIGTNSQAGWAECDEMNISIIEQLLCEQCQSFYIVLNFTLQDANLSTNWITSDYTAPCWSFSINLMVQRLRVLYFCHLQYLYLWKACFVVLMTDSVYGFTPV